MRFDSQFCRTNCQTFSWLLSSGERGGSGSSEMLSGTLRSFGCGADYSAACMLRTSAAPCCIVVASTA